MTSAEDLSAILPFLVACAGGLIIILFDAFSPPKESRKYLGIVSLLTLMVMILVNGLYMGEPAHSAFFDLVVADDFARFLGILFAVSAGLAVLIAVERMPDEGVMRGEFHALLLFATGGATLLVQAVDLVALFIGLECMSIPAYILAAAHRRDPRSVEAGFKYFVLGAFATGFLVYGIALVYGASGSTQLVKIAEVAASAPWVENPILILGFCLLLVGLGFKIGAVPFHMWAPDVYQGSPTPTTVFFATGVKAAAFAALLRLLVVAFSDLRSGTEGFEHAGWYTLFQGFAILTMTVANLAALVQRDVKRILAYSSIAHAGYLIMGLLCEKSGATAILFYLAAYTFMTAGAFALVAYFEREDNYGTSLEEYAGAGKRNPVAAVALSIFLFSLAGIPPTAGFFGKFYLFKVAVDYHLIVLVVIAVVNSLVSAYYYLRIMVYMYMAEESKGAKSLPKPSIAIAIAVGLCLLFVLVMGIFPIPYLESAQLSAESLFP